MAIRNIYTGRGNRSNVEGVNANFKYLFDDVEGVWNFLEDKGVEVISSEGIQSAINEWLANNDFKPKDAVATFNDLPQDAELKELRGVIDENAVYVYDGTKWIKQSNLNFDGLGEVKNTINNITYMLTDFGAKGDGVTNDSQSFKDAINHINSLGGGSLTLPYSENGYVIDNVEIAGSNITIDFNGNKIYKKSGTGWAIHFTGDMNMKNITVLNANGYGDNTVNANGFLAFALNKDLGHIDGLRVDNVTATQFGQYGVGIGSVSNFSVTNVRIIEHGSINADATIGIGFFIYPKTKEKNGYVSNIQSRINPKSVMTSAAIKLQVVENFNAYKIHGINGTESCISLDSLQNGVIKDIIIESEYTNSGYPGMVVNSNNAQNITSSNKTLIDGFKMLGTFSNAVSTSVNGIVGVEFKNFEIPKNRIVTATNGTLTRCKFENINAMEFRLDLYGGVATECEFTNINLQSGGSFTVSGDRNKAINVKGLNAGMIRFKGNYNEISQSRNDTSTTNAFALEGNNNYLLDSISINPTGRQVYILGDGNRVLNHKSVGSPIILDSGTNTILNEIKADLTTRYGTGIPPSGTFKVGDKVINTNPTPGGYTGWICVTAGSPGTWKGYGIIQS